MYAIFENGSHQYRATAGDKLTIDRLPGRNPGDEVTFENVLLVADGDKALIGTPSLPGAKVVAEVLAEYRAKKIVIRKFRRRKGFRRKKGHRQYHTVVLVKDIVATL